MHAWARLIALHDAMRLGAADRAVERLQAAAALAEGPYPAVCAEHAAAAVPGDGDGLLAVTDRFTELGMPLHAAEAAAQAATVFRGSGQAARSACWPTLPLRQKLSSALLMTGRDKGLDTHHARGAGTASP